jgi:hypothetical protein
MTEFGFTCYLHTYLFEMKIVMGVDWWEAGCVDCSRRRLEGEGREPYSVPSLLLASQPDRNHLKRIGNLQSVINILVNG